MTLQHPDQAIGRYIRLPDNWPEEGAEYRLLVRLQDRYEGPARLLVEINGVPLGSLHPTTSGGDTSATLGLPIPSEVLARQRVTEIILRQDRPDRKLRIVIYREWAGATLGADASWFYDGARRGIAGWCMRCPVAWFPACHTSGWSECLDHMKERLAQQPVKDSSAVVAMWLQVVRSQAFVGLFLAVLILLLAWPRLTGPSWTTFQMPFDLRESEGNTVQWEQIHHFNALRATLQSEAGWVIEGSYSTDHYRGLLPIYVSAIFAYWLDSNYRGFALADLLGWWIAAWALYYLARRLDTDHLSALLAAVLLAASPLLISHMWRNAVHVVHSASLVPCFLVALLLLTDKRLVHGWRVIGLVSVLYVASLIYQYQWIIVPCLLAVAVVDRRRWIWSAFYRNRCYPVRWNDSLNAIKSLDLFGLSVHAHLNDPLDCSQIATYILQ